MKLTTLIRRLQGADRSYRKKYRSAPHAVEIYTRRDLGDHVIVLSRGVQRRSSKYGHILEDKGRRRRLTIQL